MFGMEPGRRALLCQGMIISRLYKHCVFIDTGTYIACMYLYVIQIKV